MPQIIHPPDPWGGPRFALDVFGALIGAWDRIQNLQERKETRQLINEARALDLFLKTMEMPEEWHLRFADQINALAERAKLPPIVVEGKVYRPTQTQLEERLAQLQTKRAQLLGEALEGLKLGPEELRRIGVGTLVGDIYMPERAKKMEAETKHIETETELAKKREERMERLFPLEERLKAAQLGHIVAKTGLVEAQKYVLLNKTAEDPSTGTRVYQSSWEETVKDPQTGEEKPTGRIMQGFVVFNKQGELISKVPMKQVPIAPDVYNAERKHVNNVLQQFAKEKKRDIDWEDEEEVKDLAARYAFFGRVIVRRGGTEKKPKFWLEIHSNQTGMMYPVGPVFEERDVQHETKRSAFETIIQNLIKEMGTMHGTEVE
mgnify:CR=1 FL=1